MSIANTFITDWDAKFHYNFWRPVTAIRNGDTDGNDATERDAGWTPLFVTAMHPEYPSQASIQAGAAAGVLETVIRHRTGFAIHRNGYRRRPPTTPVYQHRANGRRAGDRYASGVGVHFRNTVEVSDQMGRKIAAARDQQRYDAGSLKTSS